MTSEKTTCTRFSSRGSNEVLNYRACLKSLSKAPIVGTYPGALPVSVVARLANQFPIQTVHGMRISSGARVRSVPAAEPVPHDRADPMVSHALTIATAPICGAVSMGAVAMDHGHKRQRHSVKGAVC